MRRSTCSTVYLHKQGIKEREEVPTLCYTRHPKLHLVTHERLRENSQPYVKGVNGAEQQIRKGFSTYIGFLKDLRSEKI